MSELHSKIPNNVNLSGDPKLQRALEAWQPNFLKWWMEMGPEGFQADDIYLRTAVSVEPGGWAHFDHVKMPDYRWGIFLTPPETDRKIPCGDHFGEKIWNEVPGEFRKELRRMIVTQGDTEPASVEQQRLLGKCCPSLIDLRNLFQVNVEEGRHLWAMVYLLHQYFGKDGREEAEDMLVRRSGHPDSPRILGAFNKPINDWLAFYCFTMFTDRDGKYQLASLAESAFDPLARSTQFMLTEEAHHLSVGEGGIARVVERTAQLMKTAPGGDVRREGGIPLEIVQKYINEWYSASLDLFGSEDSSNAATYFGQSLKGRYNETDNLKYPDHVAKEGVYILEVPTAEGRLTKQEIPLRRAINAIIRDSYTEDCERALRKWNKVLADAGQVARLYIPSIRFNRLVGLYANQPFDAHGALLAKEDLAKRMPEFLPTAADGAYVKSLMISVTAPGKVAGWVAAPNRGINGKPWDWEYVRFATPRR